MDEWSQEKVCKIPSFLLRSAGHGPVTGRCVATDRARLAARGVTVCEIQSWCPVEDDRLTLGLTRPLISGSDKHTVYIKNSIRFSYFGDAYHRNNLPAGICNYVFDKPSSWLCNIFKLGTSHCDIRWNLNGLIFLKYATNLRVKQYRSTNSNTDLGRHAGTSTWWLCVVQEMSSRRPGVTTPSSPSRAGSWPSTSSGSATWTGTSIDIVCQSEWSPF